jgi:hypothetical protein
VIRRGSKVFGHTEILVAVAYLAQHLAGHPNRKVDLIGELRAHWSSLNDQERGWFLSYWPEAAPTGPAPGAVSMPEPSRLRSWVREYFFQNEILREASDAQHRPPPVEGVFAVRTPVEFVSDHFADQGARRGALGVVVAVQDSGYEVQLIQEDGWGPQVGPVPSTYLRRHGR